MCSEALFTIAKARKQPDWPMTDGWIKKMWYIFTQRNSTQPYEERTTAICSNIDGLRDYHTK